MPEIVFVDNDRLENMWETYRQEAGLGLFLSLKWKKLLEEGLGYRPYYHLAIEGTGNSRRTIGLIPLILHRNLKGEKTLISLPFANYVPLGVNQDCHLVWLEWLRYLNKKAGASYVQARWLEKYNALEHTTDDSNELYLFPLHGKESQDKLKQAEALAEEILDSRQQDVWNGLSRSKRNHIRKGLKETQCQVRLGWEPDVFWEVYRRRMRELGSPYPAKSFFHMLKGIFGEQVFTLTFWEDEIPVGVMCLFRDNEHLVYQWGGTDTRYAKEYLSNRMYWEAIKLGCQEGFQWLDMGRSPKGSGTAKFKSMWGAQAKPLYYQYIMMEGSQMPAGLSGENVSPLLKLGQQIWPRLPLTLTDLAGPPLIKLLAP